MPFTDSNNLFGETYNLLCCRYQTYCCFKSYRQYAPFTDLMLVISIMMCGMHPGNFIRTLLFYIEFLLVDVFVSVFAFSFENEKNSKLIWLIPQRFVYRQLMYVLLFKALRKAIKGESQQWGALKRTGNVNQLEMIPLTTPSHR